MFLISVSPRRLLEIGILPFRDDAVPQRADDGIRDLSFGIAIERSFAGCRQISFGIRLRMTTTWAPQDDNNVGASDDNNVGASG
jgi:hypothetical protein